MKTLFLILTILFVGLIKECNAQFESLENHEIIHEGKIYYQKISKSNSSFNFYTNVNDTLVMNNNYMELYDQNALINLPKNKLIFNLLKKITAKNAKADNHEIINLIINFKKEGKISNMSFMLSKNIKVNLTDLNFIEEQLKVHLNGIVKSFDSNKIYSRYTIIVKLKDILEGSYSY